MTDYTDEITTLQRKREQMQRAKKMIEIDVKQRYAERIREDIAAQTEAEEIAFAKALHEAWKSGVPQALLRSEVLRTNVWSRWTYWRDLAGIEPDRVVTAKTREEKAEAAREWWIDAEEATYTHRFPNGETRTFLLHPTKPLVLLTREDEPVVRDLAEVDHYMKWDMEVEKRIKQWYAGQNLTPADVVPQDRPTAI